ncbi:MAG: Ig-like domain-containing protein [Bdellovibrio sp.]
MLAKNLAVSVLLLVFLLNTGCSISVSLSDIFSKKIEIGESTPTLIGNGSISNTVITGKCGHKATSIDIGSPANLTVDCVDGEFSVTVDLSFLSETTHTITVTSNTGETAKWDFTIDKTAPTISLISASAYINLYNSMSFSISGTCSEFSRAVTVSVGIIPYTFFCINGIYNGDLDLSSLPDGSVTISASQSDLAENSTSVSLIKTKDTIVPGIAVLTGVPEDPSSTQNLNISVSGVDVVNYAYKIGVASSIDCSNFSGFSSFVPIANGIIDNISGVADGSIRLCVLTEDIAGNRQTMSNVVVASWVKDSTVALSTISGFSPSGLLSNSGADRTLTVGGANITHYKAVVAYNQNCAGADFSAAAETAVSSPFTLSIGLDGGYQVCVIGKNVAGYWQSNLNPTSSDLLTIDRVSPSLTLSTATPDSFNSASFIVTATFSENVTGFTLSDIIVTNGVASGFSGSGSNYTFTVTPTAQGLVSVDIPTNSAQDSANNNILATANLTRTYDSLQPTLVLSSASSDTFNSASFMVTATFSESVTGFTLSDVNVTNGVASGFSGSGSTYTFTVTPSAQGLVSVDVAAGTALDSAGNLNLMASTLSKTYDSIAPSITGLADDGLWKKSKTWSWGCSELCTYRYAIDTVATTTPAGGYGATTSATQSSGSGTYYLHVQAQDAGGNTSLVHVYVLLDNTSPTTPSWGSDGTTLSSLIQSPTIVFTAGTDTNSGVQKNQLRVLRASDNFVMKDWHDFSSGNPVTGLSLASDTAYKIEVKTIDNVNLESIISASDGWIADTNGPGAPGGLSVGAVPTSTSSSPTLNWSAASDGSGSGIAYYQAIVYRTSDNAAMSSWTTLASGGTITGISLTGGAQYYFQVRAVDNAGNVGSASAASSSWTANSTYLLNYTISSSIPNFDVRATAVASGWNQVVPLAATITVNPGVFVYSNSTGVPAFVTGNSFPAGSSITLINNGYIVGKGGTGGNGDWTYGPQVGTSGGPALSATQGILIYNYGVIGGGGGGGGAGGNTGGWMANACGSGGGGGAGFGNPGSTSGGCVTSTYTAGGIPGGAGSGNAGGAGGPSDSVYDPNLVGTIYGGAGGNGGGLGAAGATGGTGWGGFDSTPGNAGGAGGAAVLGNSSISWGVTGSLLGTINP